RPPPGASEGRAAQGLAAPAAEEPRGSHSRRPPVPPPPPRPDAGDGPAGARFRPALAVRIVGSGPERDGLTRLARELGVPCTIDAGLPEAEMVTAYRSAEGVVCPS